jgi:hypothetical protein
MSRGWARPGEPVLRLVQGVPGSRQARLAGETARAATTDGVEALRHEAGTLKEVVAEQALELRSMNKSMTAAEGRSRMRYPASEKLGIIRLVRAVRRQGP